MAQANVNVADEFKTGEGEMARFLLNQLFAKGKSNENRFSPYKVGYYSFVSCFWTSRHHKKIKSSF